MKIFEKKNKSNKTATKRLININALKKGGYLTVVIIAVLVIAVFLNIGTHLLDKRGYLRFDLTPAKLNTLSEENREFLKKIDKEVQITVLCTESEYASTVGQYLEYYMNITTTEDYFAQTVKLLNQYEAVNKKISVEFVDFSGVQAKAIQEKYPNAFVGDIYVEVEGKGGKPATKIVGYDKIYPASDPSGYAAMGYSSYEIDGNDLETALSSAINSLVNGEDEIMGVINAHAPKDAVSNFKEYYTSQLEYNGFSTVDVEGTVLKEIPKDVSVLAIVAPTADYLESEIKVISEWLENDGKKGRSLIFCPGDTISNMPNLTQFLEEWGISYGSGYLYQTDPNQYYSSPTIVYSYVNDNDVAKKLNGSADGTIITSYNLPIEIAFKNYSSKTTNIIASTNDMATICPIDAKDDWKPSSNAKVKSYPTIVVTSDSTTVDGKVLSSHVAAFSAFNIIADVGSESFINLDISMNTARYISGMETTSQKLFVTRKLESETFAGEVSEAGSTAIRVIFVIVLPLAFVAMGVVVWIRRRKR